MFSSNSSPMNQTNYSGAQPLSSLANNSPNVSIQTHPPQASPQAPFPYSHTINKVAKRTLIGAGCLYGLWNLYSYPKLRNTADIIPQTLIIGASAYYACKEEKNMDRMIHSAFLASQLRQNLPLVELAFQGTVKNFYQDPKNSLLQCSKNLFLSPMKAIENSKNSSIGKLTRNVFSLKGLSVLAIGNDLVKNTDLFKDQIHWVQDKLSTIKKYAQDSIPIIGGIALSSFLMNQSSGLDIKEGFEAYWNKVS